MNVSPLIQFLAEILVRQQLGDPNESNNHDPKTPRAAIYARFSTDKQRDTSVEDQFRVCRQRAESLGLTIVAHHKDDGVSGSTPVDGRAGGVLLLADAMAGRFEVLLLEGLDRLSRDSVEQERIVRRLEHRGIRIIGVSDGYDSDSGASRKIYRGMRGLINEIFLDDLRAKTHRGLAGQVERGFHAGGLSYGYRSVDDGRGHRLAIDETQAEWVRWIFARYADGWSCQRIAAELNAQGVVTGRGGTWSVSALYGSPNKGSGVLNNELYVGRYIWNRSQWVKDPDSGKRKRIVRPETEWQVRECPELRIVDDVAWSAARARMGQRRHTDGPRPRTLFGGLLRCGLCGGAVVAVSSHRYGCAARKDRGKVVCPGVLASRKETDARLLSLLRDELLSPGSVEELQREVDKIFADAKQHAGIDQESRAARTRALDAEISRLVDGIATVGVSEALAVRLRAAEAARAALSNEPVALPVASATGRYRALQTTGLGLTDGARNRCRSRPNRDGRDFRFDYVIARGPRDLGRR